MRRFVSATLSALKYILGAFMIYSGIITTGSDAPDVPTALDWIYEERESLILFGTLFGIIGASLIIGKLLNMRRVVGLSLAGMYACFLFFGITNWIVLGWKEGIGNLVMALVTGALYLRWKHHVWYAEEVDSTHPVM